MSNSQLNKLKLRIKHGTEITLETSSNVVGDSSYENNFPHNLLLINTKVPNLRKAFTSNYSANLKLSRT